MQIPLSSAAKRKRKTDMLEVVGEIRETDPVGFARIMLLGVLYSLIQMAHKLPRNQRAALAAVAIVAGGALIGLTVYSGFTWLALVIMFALGFVLSEISKL